MKLGKKVLSLALCFMLLVSTVALGGISVSAEYEKPWIDNGENSFISTSSIYDPDGTGADWYIYGGILFNKGPKDIPGGWQTCQISINNKPLAPNIRTYIVDEGIVNIGGGATTTPRNGNTELAFQHITYVYISSTVKTIGANAFSGSTVEKVYIYSTDCAIANNAFNNTCTIYGYSGSTAETYANEHNLTFIEFDDTMFDKVYNYKEATCTEEGYSGDIVYPWNFLKEKGHTVEKLEHEIITHEGKEATCTEPGYEPYETCENCDYTTYEAISPIGHDEITHEGKAATCTEAGYEPYVTCSRCDYTTYQAINPLGHDIVHHEAKTANCTESGYDAYDTCSRCDYTTYGGIISATGHKLKTITNPPTCENAGSEYNICEYCQNVIGETTVLKPTGHQYSEEIITNATCTESGEKKFTCHCGDTYTETINPLGHSFTNYKYNNDATTERDGTETAKCDRCSATDTRTKSGTRIENPTANARINVKSSATVDYRSKVIITATADNVPSGYFIAIYDGNSLVKRGNNKTVTYEAGEMTATKTYTVKVIDSGRNVQKDAGNNLLEKEVKVEVKSGFFDKIIALFKGWFNLLPTVEIKP